MGSTFNHGLIVYGLISAIKMNRIILLVSVVVSCAAGVFGVHEADILNLYKKTFSGDGTYYGSDLGGMCTLNTPTLPPVAANVDKRVALNSPQMFGTGLGCGMCFKVTGSGQGAGNDPITGTFIAYVTDLCPECHAGSVDLAETGDGRWGVNIQAVQCPVGNTKIQYKLQGSNPWYIKLQVRNERMPATKVEMYQPNHRVWVALTRTRDAYWILPSDSRVEKPVKAPFKVRLHAPNGQTVVDTVHADSQMTGGTVLRGSGVQFPLDPSLPHA